MEALADQLAEIRASGFAYECEESTRGIRCIGVPLRKSGKVVAALSVAFPLERYSDAAAASARQALAWLFILWGFERRWTKPGVRSNECSAA